MFQALSNRLEGYSEFTSQAQMRRILAAQGGVKSRGNAIAARLAELKGQTDPDEALKP